MKTYLAKEQILERIQALPKKSKYLTRDEINQRIKLAQELGLFTKNLQGFRSSIRGVLWAAVRWPVMEPHVRRRLWLMAAEVGVLTTVVQASKVNSTLDIHTGNALLRQDSEPEILGTSCVY